MSFPEGLKNNPFNTTPPYYHCPSLSSEPQGHKRNNNTHKTALVWVWNSWRLWSHGQSKKEWNLRFLLFSLVTTHCKCFDHKNYRDRKLQGTCRENLHYLWKRAVRIAGNPCDNYRTNNFDFDFFCFISVKNLALLYDVSIFFCTMDGSSRILEKKLFTLVR